MQKGLEILASGNILPGGAQNFSEDTNTQLNDLMTAFWNDLSITVDQVQADYAAIIASAD